MFLPHLLRKYFYRAELRKAVARRTNEVNYFSALSVFEVLMERGWWGTARQLSKDGVHVRLGQRERHDGRQHYFVVWAPNGGEPAVVEHHDDANSNADVIELMSKRIARYKQ